MAGSVCPLTWSCQERSFTRVDVWRWVYSVTGGVCCLQKAFAGSLDEGNAAGERVGYASTPLGTHEPQSSQVSMHRVIALAVTLFPLKKIMIYLFVSPVYSLSHGLAP